MEKYRQIILLLLTGLTACSTLKTSNTAQEHQNTLLQPFISPAKDTESSPLSAKVIDLQETAEKREIDKTINLPGHLPYIENLTPPSPGDPNDKNDIRLNYEQITVGQVIAEIADSLNLSLIMDAEIAEKVTIRTAPDKPLRQSDLWPLLHLLLTNVGARMEKIGSVYHIKKEAAVLPDTFVSDAKESAFSKILQITPLHHVSANAVIPLINPLIDAKEKDSVTQLATLNILAITSSPPRLEKVNHLLRIIDSDPFSYRSIRLFYLKNAKASEVGTELEGILRLIEGEKSIYQIMGLDRINAVLAVSLPERGFSEIERWINILDTGSQDQAEQIFIYKMRSLKASALSSTLNQIFNNSSAETTTSPTKPTTTSSSESNRNNFLASIDKKPPTPPTPEITQPPPIRNTPPNNASKDSTTSEQPSVSIVADDVTNSLMIRSTARDYRYLLETIRSLDNIPPQVLMNVIIAQVTLTDKNKFGVDWQRLSQGGEKLIATSFNIPNEPSGITGLVINDGYGRITSALNALKSVGDVKVLSRPSIMVVDNQKGVIKVGSEVPVVTQQVVTDTDQVTGTRRNDVQYRDTGIILNITPHVNEDGMINMEIEQELSSVGEQISGLTSFNNQQIVTTVVARHGHAIVLGGLIQTDISKNDDSVPFLGQLPLLGHLFSSHSVSESRRELILIIIPEIIKNDKDNEQVLLQFKRQLKEAGALFN